MKKKKKILRPRAHKIANKVHKDKTKYDRKRVKKQTRFERVTIELPVGSWRKLSRIAEIAEMSLNTVVVVILAQYLTTLYVEG